MYVILHPLGKCKDLADTAKEYRDGSVLIEDPREEAAQIFEALRDTLMSTWAPDLSDLTKITAAQYNSMLLSRRYGCLFNALSWIANYYRSSYLKMIRDDPNNPTRRKQLMELTPSPAFLFGGEVQTACAAMRDSMELNPLLANHYTIPKRGRGGRGFHPYSGGGCGGHFSRKFDKEKKKPEQPSRGRGSGRGSRLSKFRDN